MAAILKNGKIDTSYNFAMKCGMGRCSCRNTGTKKKTKNTNTIVKNLAVYNTF